MPLFLINTLLLYILLLALTVRQNHRRRVKYTRFTWAGETFFTVVLLCQFFCCGRKANLIQFFLLNLNFLLVHRNKVSVTVYLFFALYGSTTIQSLLFLKNIENFFWFPKQYLLGFLILEKQLANILDRGFLFLHNTLLLYSLCPYSQTESQTESQIHSLRVGWTNFFSSCAVVSTFGSSGK